MTSLYEFPKASHLINATPRARKRIYTAIEYKLWNARLTGWVALIQSWEQELQEADKILAKLHSTNDSTGFNSGDLIAAMMRGHAGS